VSKSLIIYYDVGAE